MPAIREHDIPCSELDDDDGPSTSSSRFHMSLTYSLSLLDGMPPLVDNPNPSMTFTFFTDMTPITAFTADPTLVYDTIDDNGAITNGLDHPSVTSPSDLVEYILQSVLRQRRALHVLHRAQIFCHPFTLVSSNG